MLSIETEKRIAKLFMILAEGERTIEISRQVLSDLKEFDSYQLFKNLDIEGKNKIDYCNIVEYLRNKGIYASDEEAQLIILFYDQDYDTVLSYSEFINLIQSEKVLQKTSYKSPRGELSYNVTNDIYIPFSELKNVYNVDIKYSKEKNIVTSDSLNREQKMGNCSSDTGVKYKPTIFSKSLENVKKGDSVIVIGEENGWYKVRTLNGIIGYLKDVANIYSVRDNMETEKQVEGKVSLIWDYFPT